MQSRARVLAALIALSIITYLDRICIAVAGPRMQDELGISPDKWGWVLGAFVLSYAVFEIPMGALGDRYGQRGMLTRIVLWWSAFTAATGLVSSYRSLVAIRFLFGAGEAGAYPNMAAVVAKHFPPTGRARAQGAVWAASRLGGAMTPLMVLPLQAAFGWRASFWVFGAIGFVWAALWWLTYRDPQAAAAGGASRHEAPWGMLLRDRRIWLIMAMYFCYVWGAWFYFSWFQTYLVKGRGFSQVQMGVITGAAFLLGATGNLAGGTLADRLSRRLGLATGRRIVGAGALAISAVCLFATALAPTKALVVVFSLLGLGVMDCMLPCAWAVSSDLGGRHAGAVTGAMNTAGQLGGFVCSIAFGHLVQRFGRYDVPLLVVASLTAISALLFWRIGAGASEGAAATAAAGGAPDQGR